MKLNLLLTVKYPHFPFVTAVKRFIFACTEESTAIIFFIRLLCNETIECFLVKISDQTRFTILIKY